ncbi:hypothetical protein HZB03_04840, partial [Candidatus Woesearchaeota archaeon]|nr:hypothetical protein [Candidatus Woesearchaeota archaeon]
MRYAIITSTQDLAAMNIKDHLLLSGSFHELDEPYERHPIFEHKSGAARLYTVDRSNVDCEGIDSEVDADFIIFATRHRAESGIPSLTVHVCGNFSEARLGGKERQISVAMPSHMKAALNFMFDEVAKHPAVSVEIVQEAT